MILRRAALGSVLAGVALRAAAGCTAFDGLTFTADAGADALATTPPEAGADATASVPGSYPEAVLADRPVAYWRFEDGAGAVARDETGGDDCEYIGAIERVPSVVKALGAAIALPGQTGAHVLCRDAPFDRPGTQHFSLEAWIRPRTIDSVYRKVFSKDVDDPRAGYNLSVVAPGLVRAERFAGGVELCGVTASITAGTWAHVVVTYDGAVVSGSGVAEQSSRWSVPST